MALCKPGRAGSHHRVDEFPDRHEGEAHRAVRHAIGHEQQIAVAHRAAGVDDVGDVTVALVVGGVGITNVMVISVLERRSEIGVRRALGARRAHVAAQFLVEAAVLATLGGVAGAALGAAVTTLYATSQGWLVDVPVAAVAGGAAAALAVGLLAGVSPAVRAARLDPADAVRPQ